MAWYKTGTIAVTKNSKTITGTGTTWADAKQGVGAGQMLLLPAAGTVAIYEIASVQSNTQLTLIDAFIGTTATAQAYAIVTTYIDSVPDFARRLATQLTYYQAQLDGWQSIMTGSGDITLTAPDGTAVKIKSMAAVTTAISNMLDRTKNGSDIADKAAFRNNLGVVDARDYGIGVMGVDISACADIFAELLTRGSGIYTTLLSSAALNTPVATNTGWVYLWSRYNANGGTLIAYQTRGTIPLTMKVVCVNGIWGAWRVEGNNPDTLSTKNLNDVFYPGSYYQALMANATFANNYPTTSAGSLVVITNTANGESSCHQEYRPYTSYTVYKRFRLHNTGVWSDWVRNWDANNLTKQTNPTDTTTGAMLAVGAFGLGAEAVLIANNTDLNVYFATAGSGFYKSGVTVTNGIDATADYIWLRHGAAHGVLIAVATNSGRTHTKTWRDGVWGAWAASWDNANLPSPLSEGDYGLGQGKANYRPLLDNQAAGTYFGWTSTTEPAMPSFISTSCGIITHRWQSGVASNPYELNICWREGKLGFRTKESNATFTTWRQLWHSANTTVDTNGFIKTASPVVKLFGNGESEINDECQGVTTHRLETGVYEVSGIQGFNADTAWHLEVPKDDNGQALVWVDYEVLSSGDIRVKTYHRTHLTSPDFAQNNLPGYQNGDPIDIPAGRWLDLRVQVYNISNFESAGFGTTSSADSKTSVD